MNSTRDSIPPFGAAPGSATPRSDNLLMLLKLTPEYTKEKDTDRDRAMYLCRELERKAEELRIALGDVLSDCHAIWYDSPAIERAQDLYERESPNDGTELRLPGSAATTTPKI